MMKLLDLSHLTEEERDRITQVLNRDELIQKKEDARVRRLQGKAEKTNNATIKKKVLMRSGDWFWQLAEKQGGLKRSDTATATIRASLRLRKTPDSQRLAASDPSIFDRTQGDASPNKLHLSPERNGEHIPMDDDRRDSRDDTRSRTLDNYGSTSIQVSLNDDNFEHGKSEVNNLPAVEPSKPETFPKQTTDSSSEEDTSDSSDSSSASGSTYDDVTDEDEGTMAVQVPLAGADDEGTSKHVQNPPESTYEKSQTISSNGPQRIDGILTDKSQNVTPKRSVTNKAGETSNTEPSSKNPTEEERGEGYSSYKRSNEAVYRVPSIEVDVIDSRTFSPGMYPISESDSDSDKIEELSDSIKFLQNIDRGSKKGSTGRSTPNLSSSTKLKPSFGSSWSVHSTTTGAIRSDIEITGSVELSFEYSYKSGTLNVCIGGCKDLASVDKKKHSNPYVKTYLLPDRHSKRKTKAKRKTLNPEYNETLKYTISESELHTRTLNVAVWHDKVGVNVFLGEVNIDMSMCDFKTASKMKKYYLRAKIEDVVDSFGGYLGETNIALRLNMSGKSLDSPTTEGDLEIVMKNVKNAATSKGKSSDIYVKSYFLPDKEHATKQKTPIVTGKDQIDFDHLFMYTNVRAKEIDHRCIEITVWQREKFGANQLIGGTRIGCGDGMSFDVAVPWMDSTAEEIDVWRRMKKSHGSWVDGHLNLRTIEPTK